MVFVLDFVYMLHYVDWFVNVLPSLYPWNEIYLFMVSDLFNVLLDSVTKYFIEDFQIHVH
jgi:hypothetical protein